MSFKLTCNRLSRLACLGFRGRRGRHLKAFMLCQWLFIGLLLYTWIAFFGGLWPGFLPWGRRQPVKSGAFDTSLVDYFSAASHDGIYITWAHGVNNRESLQQALYGDVMMLEADISLPIQSASKKKKITPMMGRSLESTSDLTFSEWLMIVKDHQKGIKLDFKTIDAVEEVLRRLSEIQDEWKGPVHLSALVLDGTSDGQFHSEVIDADRFLHLCSTVLPESTVAVGWVIDQGTLRYNWTLIKTMYDLIDRLHLHQPVTFTVRANLVHRSIAQLTWLMEMIPESTLTVVSSSPSDSISIEELLNVRRHLPKHAVYYDIPKALQDQFIDSKDVSHFRYEQDAVEKFVAEQWKVVRSRDGETIYLGTEAVVLRTGLLVTKAEYEATPRHPVVITGRVEFFNTSTSGTKPSDVGMGSDELGLVVFIRASQSSRQDSVSGIRCFFGIGGELRLALHKVPGTDSQSQAALPGTSPCIAFRIIDRGSAGIEAHAARPKSCNADFAINKDVDFEATVKLNLDGIEFQNSLVAIKQSVPIGFIAVDRFSIRTQRSTKQHL